MKPRIDDKRVALNRPAANFGSGLSVVRLSTRALSMTAYAPPQSAGVIDLHLDANEGSADSTLLAGVPAAGADLARRYPSQADLERFIAAEIGVTPDRVLITAGGDDAIDRACRAVLDDSRTILLPVPTFEMIERSAIGAGACVVQIPWRRDEYPLAAVLDQIDERTGMMVVVSPNNPTGTVATEDDLRALSVACPNALVLADLAYTEFADDDLTATALALPNVVVVRTFSKAFGLAGLRIGYAVGPAEVIRAMRSLGSPYPVSGQSLEIAHRAFAARASIIPPARQRVQQERSRLDALLQSCGVQTRSSQANFVLAEFDDALWVRGALASLGISVRGFTSPKGGVALDRMLRITCPGCERAFQRLCGAISTILRPEALLLDMDGVIADVSGSYRQAIIDTAAVFGVTVSRDDVARAKAAGDSNNDWVVTHRLVLAAGVSASLTEVTARFEALYQGDSNARGLRESEQLIADRALLEALAARTKLAIVTGRPRSDCERFLRRFQISGLFGAVVCLEDAALKPDPAPVRLAMERLGVRTAWMVGDTRDDLLAARRAGALPLGVAAPGDGSHAARTLADSGAAAVVGSLDKLLELFP